MNNVEVKGESRYKQVNRGQRKMIVKAGCQ